MPITAHSATPVDFDDDVLDLRRVDVEPVDDDELFESVDEEQVAVAVEEADVTRRQPAIRVGGLVAVGPVAAEEVGATHQYLARVVGHHVVAAVVDEPQLDSWQGSAGRAGLVLRSTQRRGHDRCRLGQSIPLLDRDVRPFLERPDQHRVHRRRTREQRTHGFQLLGDVVSS